MRNFNLPALGGGAGLRHEHFEAILEKRPPFRWFEIIVEDFMSYGGLIRETLREIRKHYPIIGHGVEMSIGSSDPLNMDYLKNLKTFLDEIDSPWTSDHLCFTMIDHTNLVDLIPLPFTQEAVKHVADRIRIVQDVLERPFMVENVTRYITVSEREMKEAEFLSAIIERSGCGLLLDVTNVHLNSIFHKFDPLEFIKSLPLERVGQMHLAGWEQAEGEELIDSHDAPVPPEVWDLFEKTIQMTGPTSALIEWDSQLQSVDRLLKETQIADELMNKYAFCEKAA